MIGIVSLRKDLDFDKDGLFDLGFVIVLASRCKDEAVATGRVIGRVNDPFIFRGRLDLATFGGSHDIDFFDVR